MQRDAQLERQFPDVSRETWAKLERYAANLIAGNDAQNLISATSVDDIWRRHIIDSLQLTRFAPSHGNWLDLGSGPGLPGLVTAAATETCTTLVESRTKRVEFLRSQVIALGLKRITIHGGRLETLPSRQFATISARAFAPLTRLLPLAARFSDPETVWIMPKGRSAAEELASVRDAWQGDFRIEPSLTDPAGGIIVASNIRPRTKAR